MRELINKDMYLISEMIDKMKLTLPTRIKVVNGEKSEKTDEEYGMEIITSIISKIYLAQAQVNQLLASVMETTVTEIEQMKLTDTVKAVAQLFSNVSLADFFK